MDNVFSQGFARTGVGILLLVGRMSVLDDCDRGKCCLLFNDALHVDVGLGTGVEIEGF